MAPWVRSQGREFSSRFQIRTYVGPVYVALYALFTFTPCKMFQQRVLLPRIYLNFKFNHNNLTLKPSDYKLLKIKPLRYYLTKCLLWNFLSWSVLFLQKWILLSGFKLDSKIREFSLIEIFQLLPRRQREYFYQLIRKNNLNELIR